MTIRPDDGSVGKIYSEPAGTIFVFEPGVYQSLTLWITKDDLQFWARPGAILDGGGTQQYAFNGQGFKNIVIANFTICNFAPLNGLGCVMGYLVED